MVRTEPPSSLVVEVTNDEPILTKLDLRDRVQVVVAYESGLVTPSG
ncbi:hypothetical protein GCM10017772_39660 [Promicromonospora soli]|uniref:Uncharacterized protein n=1 Tax=Promicromonospora soli TaxID=2035533 RepID=A0A919KYU5_9MICO|nr:hypothetical protein [Promicromonospora soli]GHH77788.1 hypothetical protein GCM10017772_39660 [Promicromonospora soli]